MVNALGRFYRLSLSKGREVIPLSDELKHAQLYVEIQNLRFENRVSVRWALDPAAAQCRIIKIVLQPLIENAIIHGIFEKPSKCGRLAVAVRREPDGIRITIEDDGVGMDEATLLSNFSPAGAGPDHSHSRRIRRAQHSGQAAPGLRRTVRVVLRQPAGQGHHSHSLYPGH